MTLQKYMFLESKDGIIWTDRYLWKAATLMSIMFCNDTC
jgi:hypothetical protein